MRATAWIAVWLLASLTCFAADRQPSSPDLVFADAVHEGFIPANTIALPRSRFETASELRPLKLVSGASLPGDRSSAEPTRVLVAPYVWVPAMNGAVTALGQTQAVDLSLGDAFGLLGDLNGAAQGHVEIGRGDWTLILDGMLMRLTPTGETAQPVPGQAEVDVSATILEAIAAWRPPGELSESLMERGVICELIGGARFYEVDAGVAVDPDNPLLPILAREQSEEWVDLLVGARTSVNVTEQSRAFVRGDFAGFGIGTSSTFTWNLTSGLEYDFTPASGMVLGYRILDINERQSSITGDFQFDVRLHGPFLALIFRF